MALEVTQDQMNNIVRNTPPGPRRDALMAAMQSTPAPPQPASAPPTAAAPATTGREDAALQVAEAKARAAEAKVEEQRIRAEARRQELAARQEIRQQTAAARTVAAQARADRDAQRAADKAASDAAKARAARLRQVEKSGALMAPHPALHATSILPTDKDVRFLDAALVAAAGAGTVLWTASRPTTAAQYGWGLFWDVLGILAAVQGSAELQYFGFGMLGANSGYLALRLVHPDLHPPQPTAQAAFVGMITQS